MVKKYKDLKKKILVLGANGYIGSKFVNKIIDDFNVIACIHSSSDKLMNLSNRCLIEQISVENENIKKIITDHQPDIVIHLAALSGLNLCEKNPTKAFKINVIGTHNVIQSCIHIGAKLIFISSREVYGIKEESYETDELLPRNIYGLTKFLGEIMIKNAKKTNNLNYVILRLTNVYGPEGYTGVNKIILNAVQESKVKIYGGNQQINLIYIDDVVSALKLVCEKNIWCNEIFNIGSNDTILIKEFSSKIESVLQKKIEFTFAPKRKCENDRFKPNLDKMKKTLQFVPQTDLIQGIKQTISWAKSLE